MRKETFDGVTLYHADCFQLFDELGEFDVTISDPPYSETTHKGARTRESLDQSVIDFHHLSLDQFLIGMEELVRLTREWVVMTVDWRHIIHLENAGLPLVRFGVWIKPGSAPQFTGDRPGVGWEAVAILHREGRKRWNGGGRHAVWTMPRVTGEHPTQKPLPLILDFVRLFSDFGDTVFDPFLGSGTTALACIDLGRKCVGIEKDEKYFDLACRRVETRLRQPNLFRQAEPPGKQGTLFDRAENVGG